MGVRRYTQAKAQGFQSPRPEVLAIGDVSSLPHLFSQWKYFVSLMPKFTLMSDCRGTGIEIEANLPNKDVGFVQKGQPVEVKVEAFNFTRYGLLNGIVISLSQDAVDTQMSSDGRAKGQPEDSAIYYRR